MQNDAAPATQTGMRLRYLRWGSGNTRCVLLLHDLGDCAGVLSGLGRRRARLSPRPAAWRGAEAPLAPRSLASRGYCVYAPDWRGHGDSTRSADARYDTAALADDLESLVLALVRAPPRLRCATRADPGTSGPVRRAARADRLRAGRRGGCALRCDAPRARGGRGAVRAMGGASRGRRLPPGPGGALRVAGAGGRVPVRRLLGALARTGTLLAAAHLRTVRSRRATSRGRWPPWCATTRGGCGAARAARCLAR